MHVISTYPTAAKRQRWVEGELKGGGGGGYLIEVDTVLKLPDICHTIALLQLTKAATTTPLLWLLIRNRQRLVDLSRWWFLPFFNLLLHLLPHLLPPGALEGNQTVSQSYGKACWEGRKIPKTVRHFPFILCALRTGGPSQDVQAGSTLGTSLRILAIGIHSCKQRYFPAHKPAGSCSKRWWRALNQLTIVDESL